MRYLRGPLVVAVAVGALAAAVLAPLAGHLSTAAAADGQVERGKYLAMTGACMECHTERETGSFALNQRMLFAGGERFDLPIGTAWSSNITPDKETGIGNATDAQIKRALREGIGIDGRKLLVMPWEVVRAYSDEDLDAIIAYLRTLTPVRHAVTAADIKAPGGRDAFYDRSARNAVPVGGATAPGGTQNPARGRYLTAVFGCVGCHGPNLAGGAPPFFASNISNDAETGVGRLNNEQIVRTVREGVKADGSPLSPVMPALTAYKYMTDDDLYNIIAYLRSAPPVSRPALPPGPPPAAAGGPSAGPVAPAALPRTGDELPVGLLAGLAGLALLALGARRARA